MYSFSVFIWRVLCNTATSVWPCPWRLHCVVKCLIACGIWHKFFFAMTRYFVVRCDSPCISASLKKCKCTAAICHGPNQGQSIVLKSAYSPVCLCAAFILLCLMTEWHIHENPVISCSGANAPHYCVSDISRFCRTAARDCVLNLGQSSFHEFIRLFFCEWFTLLFDRSVLLS